MASGDQPFAQSLGTGPFRELVCGLEHLPLAVDYRVFWIPFLKGIRVKNVDERF